MSSSVDSDVVRLDVICGPTAAGKSAIALALAEAVGATIVSADSRQVYRRFDIGTAKPSAADRQRVPHEGIDVVDPTVRYSAAQWVAGAEQWIAAARDAGRTPLIVGGTGFYLRALDAPLFREPELPIDARHALEGHLSSFSVDDLRRWVHQLDPPRAHLGRTQLLRAIEVALLTGERISALHEASRALPKWRLRYLVIDPGKALATRIEHRVDDMLRDGWVDEVQTLRHLIPSDAPAWNASGYGAIRALVEGRMTLAAARERLIVETRQYAKRQRTWFRHQLDESHVLRVDPSDAHAFTKAIEWWQIGKRSERST
jgi:tRNA dimethylallyltransferase